jgi:hypothetical protein
MMPFTRSLNRLARVATLSMLLAGCEGDVTTESVPAAESNGSAPSSSTGPQDCNGCWAHVEAKHFHPVTNACPGAAELYAEYDGCMCDTCGDLCTAECYGGYTPDWEACTACIDEAWAGPCHDVAFACSDDMRYSSQQ